MSRFSECVKEIMTCVEEGHAVKETIEVVKENLTKSGLMEVMLKEMGKSCE